PFFLIATENPTEFEGTFPLPEAQKDRFFMTVQIGYPPRDAESQMLENQRRITHPVTDLEPVSSLEEVSAFKETVVSVHVEQNIKNYILDLVNATREGSHFRLGVSPRGSLALYKGAQAHAALSGRDYVIPDDVKQVFLPICVQRVILASDYLIKGGSPGEALGSVLSSTEVPPVRQD
ncbi:MAG: AAA family ATPase, partial [Spirochaetota bacterium]